MPSWSCGAGRQRRKPGLVSKYPFGLLDALQQIVGQGLQFEAHLAHPWRQLTLVRAWKRPEAETVAFHAMMMITAFGITFLASRVLMYFTFNFMFFMLCGLIMSSIENQETESSNI